MARNNRLIELVFNDIIANQDRISSMEKFLSSDKALGITETEDITRLKELYKKMVDDISFQMEKLAYIEEMIVQLRCVELIHDEIKFSQVREYVYARTLFYRSKKDIKDIRVVVGRIDEFDEPYDDLIQDPDFLILAEMKLRDAMIREINDLKSLTDAIEDIHNEHLVESE